MGKEVTGVSGCCKSRQLAGHHQLDVRLTKIHGLIKMLPRVLEGSREEEGRKRERGRGMTGVSNLPSSYFLGSCTFSWLPGVYLSKWHFYLLVFCALKALIHNY